MKQPKTAEYPKVFTLRLYFGLDPYMMLPNNEAEKIANRLCEVADQIRKGGIGSSTTRNIYGGGAGADYPVGSYSLKTEARP